MIWPMIFILISPKNKKADEISTHVVNHSFDVLVVKIGLLLDETGSVYRLLPGHMIDKPFIEYEQRFFHDQIRRGSFSGMLMPDRSNKKWIKPVVNLKDIFNKTIFTFHQIQLTTVIASVTSANDLAKLVKNRIERRGVGLFMIGSKGWACHAHSKIGSWGPACWAMDFIARSFVYFILSSTHAVTFL